MGPIQLPDVLMQGVSETLITRIGTDDGAERCGDEFFAWGASRHQPHGSLVNRILGEGPWQTMPRFCGNTSLKICIRY